MSRKILVIEDDAAIRQGIVDALGFAGCETLEAGNGRDGLDMALKFSYDLLLLDLILPGKDGLEILRELRESRPTVPVIVLTARGAESDRVRGLKLGADDYVVKPFSVKELLARIEAVLRRSPGRPLDVAEVAIPGGKVDLARREVVFASGKRVELSERETELLRYLASHGGRAVAREELLGHVWRVDPGAETRTVDMHVARLREKLRDDPIEPDVIVTVRGKGYMLAVRSGD
jgi:DNA-binding response OmpR family regulator